MKLTSALCPATTYIVLAVVLSSCALLGIHKNVHNPKRAGKYPDFTKSKILLGDQTTKYRTCYDVIYYHIGLSVDPEKKFLKGTVFLVADAVTDFDTLQIDLHKELKLNGISFNKEKLNTIRKEGAVFVVMKRKIAAGEKIMLEIGYEGKPPVAKKPPWKGGFVWEKDKDKKPWIGVACETEGASVWWPCKDVTNDEPDKLSISITAPKDLVSVSNGQLKDRTEKDGLATYNWFVSYPINPYNVTLYIGNFKHIQDSLKSAVSRNILPIDHYVLPYNYEKAKTHLLQAKDHIDFYEKKFGEYPWYKDGFKLIESPYAGMEHQSAIAYGNGYKNDNFYGFDYIILHETAHEWWGNSITAADLSDVWLQEGFATYSEALYVEYTKGHDAYVNYMWFYRLFVKNKWPVVGPVNRRYFHYKNSDCYQKGAWVLHTLRSVINDDKLFFDILKAYYEKHKMKTSSSKDFIDVVNEKTGSDYTWFFNQYLYNRKAPVLEYYWYGDAFSFRWKNVDADFKMEAEIILDGSKTIKLIPTNKTQKISVSSQTYRVISFPNYMKLYGIEENKDLKNKPFTVPGTPSF